MKSTKISSWFACLSILAAFSCSLELPPDVQEAYHELPEKIDFNFHIKPILSDRCYKCHGPDDNARKVDFRLDLKEMAFAKLKESKGHAFVKGNVSKSVAWRRITSNDPDFHMPPPESKLSLSIEEKALITKWIKQGAEWKEHWAFIPPDKPNIPQVEGKTLNAIDNFVLRKVEENDLSPSMEADKERLIRRVTVDLTGLPPTLKEIDEFLADKSDQAYEKLVDRLLDTDAHAERMAMEWMDVARYADSHGLHADGWRLMWPWRDWVIKAFKNNLPYDDFVTWQIAGDLLPNATIEQKLATAFHRNHEMTAEGGIVPEEFRVKYVLDRTYTTATAFLGLTMECATCHDHKFDPISQKELYQMSSFFNNVNELGMTGNDGNYGPMMLLPDPETQEVISGLDDKIENTREQLKLTEEQVASTIDFVEMIASKPTKLPTPDGHYPFDQMAERTDEYRYSKGGRAGNNQSNRIQNPFAQNLDNNTRSQATLGVEMVGGKNGKALRFDDDFDLVRLENIGIFELSEGFSAGGWIRTEKSGEHQGIMGNFGDQNSTWRGWIFYLDTLNRLAVRLLSSPPHNYLHVTSGISLPNNEWHHVFFTYDGSAKAKGLRLFINGREAESDIGFDQLYKSIKPVTPNESALVPVQNPWKLQDRPLSLGVVGGQFFYLDNGALKGSLDNIKIFHQYLTAVEVQRLFDQENRSKASPISDFDEDQLLDHYLQRYSSKYIRLKEDLERLSTKRVNLLENIIEVMVMQEAPTPRKTFVLTRGQYNSPTEEVGPAMPEKILPFPEDLPKNRLGLAQWLFDVQNPLTARVTVNRYWQMIFGRGIVETPHDFGSQGALPSHPQLLDWLAIHFVESGASRTDPGYAGERRGWNVRELIKLMVLSATYRQSSVATEEHMEKDANNIYLARGPSYRLQAEIIRDNALAASGLLNRQVGGASVKPYQPEGLWQEKNEFSMILLTYKADQGTKLYRRSMYTFIRRTSPPPAMAIFDAPTRAVCTVKRENTNTPLQALVLLNDPQFVEAARVLAERMQKEGGEKLEDQIRYAFRLVTGRQPSSTEIDLLIGQYQTETKRFEEDPESAGELLKVGEYAFDENLDKTRTAALAMVASTMINHDEAYMKR